MSQYQTDSMVPNFQDDDNTLFYKLAYWLGQLGNNPNILSIQDNHYYLYQAALAASQIP
jgi:hypothetical protein